ncbi:MAG: EamA family transporter [bacterium]|nr:EamA family transporter [bacterium]
MRFFLVVLICIGMGVAGQLLLKSGVMHSDTSQSLLTNYLEMLTNPLVIVGGLFYLASSCLWLLLLQRRHLSYIYPMVSLAYVLVVIASCFLFHEQVVLIRWIGVGIICIGVSLVSQS